MSTRSTNIPLTTDAGYVMNFPARAFEPVSTPKELTEALGVAPSEVCTNARDYLALMESEEILRRLAPDMAAIARIERRE